MATYKGIKGYKVQSLASDPTISENVGQVWYNTAGKVLKYNIEGPGAWAAGGDLTAGKTGMGGAGTQTAALSFAGYYYPGGPVATVEKYDGSTWTEVSNVNSAVYRMGAAGLQTSALKFGGFPHPPSTSVDTEKYDGTTWTEANDMIIGRGANSGLGTQIAALCVGGQLLTPASPTDLVEQFDGTSWTEVGNLQTTREENACAGTTTAGLTFGGKAGPQVPPPFSVCDFSEEYDGTSWTEGNDLNTGRKDYGGAGTQTAALAVGGFAPPLTLANVEKYDGTSWSEVNDLAAATYAGRCAQLGTTAASLYFGGATPATQNTVATEEWNEPVLSVKTVTTS